jgi:hypothetical protein
VLSVISGPEHRAVDQPGRRRHLGQDCRVLLAGVVEDPGQELGSFPWRAPGPFLVQECSPLRWGQVLLNEGKHLAFFVRQVIRHDRRKVLDGAVSAASMPARAGGTCWCSITIASTAARSAGSESSRGICWPWNGGQAAILAVLQAVGVIQITRAPAAAAWLRVSVRFRAVSVPVTNGLLAPLP